MTSRMARWQARPREPLVVLDDDPTGVQTLAGIRVLLAWDCARVRAALEGRPSVHLITNTRALPAARVRPFVAAAARAALDGVPDAAIVLRGDSTLAVTCSRSTSASATSSRPPAGLCSCSCLRFLRRASHGRWDPPSNGTAPRAAARDGVRARRRVRLRQLQAARWADERSGGLAGRRRAGAAPRRAALRRACRRDRGAARPRRHGRPGGVRARRRDGRGPRSGRPGYRAAAAHGASVIVRCAPTFAGCSPRRRPRRSCRRPLQGTACWSSAARTCRNRRDNSRVSSTPGRDASWRTSSRSRATTASGEIAALAAEVSHRLAANRLAVLATPRERLVGTTSLEAGERIAAGLARVVAAVALSIPASRRRDTRR